MKKVICLVTEFSTGLVFAVFWRSEGHWLEFVHGISSAAGIEDCVRGELEARELRPKGIWQAPDPVMGRVPADTVCGPFTVCSIHSLF